ncbi:MAG: HD-GYP domain-containing protein [Anaerolineaceae bacterium]|nr:HD-GYP domain-containing protein [Anaerolineaceae bacterium]
MFSKKINIPNGWLVIAALAAASTAALFLGINVLAHPTEINFTVLLLAGLLILCTALADNFPIHIRNNIKISMISVALYLMAALLPPVLAFFTALLAMFITETLARRSRGLLWSDVLTTSLRWGLVVWAGASVINIPVASMAMHNLLYFAAALVMFVGDVLTFALHMSPVTHEPYFHLVLAATKEAGLLELVQYLIGILGALVASTQTWILLVLIVPIGIAYLIFKKNIEMQARTRKRLEDLADEVDRRDSYTGGHSRRVAELCRLLLDAMSIRGPERDLIITAARLHDIGKINISDDILRKPGRLTIEEFEIVHKHCDHGAAMVNAYPDFSRGRELVRCHHEYWNGIGYPAGLKGYDIPFGARVIAVADSFDAMTTDRPYRRARTRAEALAVLANDGGNQWDPAVVQAFLKLAAEPANEAQLFPLKPVGEPTA